jgi:glutathione S-transferase
LSYDSFSDKNPACIAYAPRFRRDIENPAKVLDAELADGRAFVAGQHVTIAD